jgi:hypothetical protein
MRRYDYTDAECDERSRRALRLNLAQYLRTGYHGPRWTEAQLRLLSQYPDELVAEKIDRTVVAVRCKRTSLGIPTALDRRRRPCPGRTGAGAPAAARREGAPPGQHGEAPQRGDPPPDERGAPAPRHPAADGLTALDRRGG